ncbi:MAG TPA: SDR family oxidoreductase [Chloroflexota bacterium]|nr:SDR family oxidoreductase [Chloroflexota bacterium]
MDLELNGKKALITGGSRGLGRAAALALAGEGCDIAIVARTQETLDQTAAELRETGVRVLPIKADVTDPDDIRRMVAEGSAGLGGLDILIANAGGQAGGELLESSDADWQFTLDINLLHAVRSIRAITPFFKDRGGGSIVVVSSVTGAVPSVPAQYGVAKAAELYLASALAMELAQFNVRINAIAPGSIMFEGGGWARRLEEQPEAMADFADRQFPFKRLGRADEIGDVIAFLVSARASWITGATIPVDGAQVNPGLFSPADLPGPEDAG